MQRSEVGKKKKSPLLSARRAWLREEPTGSCLLPRYLERSLWWPGRKAGQVHRLKACLLSPPWPFPAKKPTVHPCFTFSSWDSSLLSPHLNPAIETSLPFLRFFNLESPLGALVLGHGPKGGPRTWAAGSRGHSASFRIAPVKNG